MNKANQLPGKPWTENRTNFDRNLAVVIGIDLYENHPNIHNLSTPASDANAFADLLETEYEYKTENVLRLINEKATLKELRIQLTKKLPDELKPTDKDRLIFYFAGHGLPKNSDEGPTGYLVPQDAKLGQESSFLSMSEVYEALNQLQCHHLLVVLDCCFAGTFRWANSRKLIAELETIRREHYDRFIRHPAWQVITSSAHDQEALDFVKLSKDRRGNPIQVNNEPHSPFALALLEALQEGEADSQGKRYQNADYTKDGVITAHELFVYLSDRVSQLAKELQTPGLYPLKREYDKGEFIFVKPGFDPLDPDPKKGLTFAPELNEENNPYRGLKSFEERHANFFFGRQKLVEELGNRLGKSHRPLTVVLGTSGSGKSSLVKAGLVPYLRQKEEKDESAQRWYILDPIRPGKSPFAELARAVLPVANSNLISRLADVSFMDRRFAEILEPKSKQEAASQNLTSSGDREQPSSDNGDKSFDATKLAERWNKATPEAKLLLVLDYFEQLQDFFHLQSEEQAQLSSLHDEINNTLKPLTENLQHQPESFIELMTVWIQKNPKTKLLLVIDQFEELITMSQDDRESGEQSDSQEQDQQKRWQRFLTLLRMTLAKYRRQLHVIVTLRSDFEPRFLNSALKAQWKEARFPVRAMNSDELRDAIEGPALKQALYFEPPELVGKLIDEVGQMPGALPLLSFTLSELYIKLFDRWMKDRSTDRALRIEEYEKLGGVAGALTRRATEEYDDLVRDFGEASGKVYQATMQRIMLRMVTIEAGGLARRRVLESELVYPSQEENKRVKQVSDRLVKARLLVKGQETGEPYIEPAHDFLVRGWDRLQRWIEAEQENLSLQQRLTPATLDWDKSKQFDETQSDDYLWSNDPRLDLLKEIINAQNDWLNALEQEFIRKSLQKRKFDYEERLKVVLSRQLAAQARNLVDTQPDLALLLAAKGYQTKDITETRSSLLHCLNAHRRLQIYLHNHKYEITDLAFSPDSSRLATLDYLGAISTERVPKSYLVIWDTESYGIVRKFENTEGYSCINWAGTAFDIGVAIGKPQPISRSVGQDGFKASFTIPAPLGNPPTTKPIAVMGLQPGNPYYFKLQAHTEDINQILFSDDGQLLVSGDRNGTIILWDLNRQTELVRVSDNGSSIERLKWLISGQELISVEGSWIRIRTLPSLEVKQQKLFETDIDALEISPDGNTLAFLSGYPTNKSLIFYDFSTQQFRGFPLSDHRGMAFDLAFNRDGSQIFTAGGGGNLGAEAIIAWDVSTHQKIETLLVGFNYTINRLVLSPDGQTLVAGGSDRKVILWNLTQHISIPETILNLSSPATCVAASSTHPDYAVGHSNGTIAFYTLNEAKPVRQVECAGTAALAHLAYSSDSQRLVSVQVDRTLTLWDTEKFHAINSVVSCHQESITDVAFAPQNNLIATCSSDGSVVLWSGDSLDLISVLPFLTRDQFRLSVTMVGEEKNDSPLAWPICCLSFAPNQPLLVALAMNGLRCWDLQTYQPIELSFVVALGAQATGTGQGIAYSPDGQFIITASSTQLTLWRADNLDTEVEKRDAHQGQVKHVVFDPDNKHFVSFGGEELIFWELQQPEPIGKVEISEDLSDLAYTSDGKFLIGCTASGQVVIWHIHPDSWADLAYLKANRDFTEKERLLYLDVNI